MKPVPWMVTTVACPVETREGLTACTVGPELGGGLAVPFVRSTRYAGNGASAAGVPG